jgi:8-oxo-dGTP diphosphatase
VHVVAGVVRRGDEVFVTRRPSGVHQGGKWEFPGGKVDGGESPDEALYRELREEIGVEIQNAKPCLQILHDYPEKRVFLDVYEITEWSGEPHGHEGQVSAWRKINSLGFAEFPAADRRVLVKLQLPPLYLISAAALYGKQDFLSRLERAALAGARLVQLREPDFSEKEFIDYARSVLELCRAHDVRLVVNAGINILDEIGAHGIQLNRHRLSNFEPSTLDGRYLTGASCHDVGELTLAQDKGIDFCLLSPVLPTKSHPDSASLEWDRFAVLCAGTNIPVYALGGVAADDLPHALRVGAHGIAMMRGAWDGDIEANVQRCMAAV